VEERKTTARADAAAWAVLAAAAALRVAGAWGARAVTDMDTSVVALMARHIAHGIDWPVFFYGQSYMGSLEPAGSALVMRLFGDGGFALALGPVLFSMAALWALWRWARDAAGAVGGAVAVALGAVGPLVHFQFQYAARGGYMAAVLVDALVLWGAGRLAADWWTGRNGGTWRAAVLGLAAGVGVWTDPIVVPALSAAAAVLLLGMRGRILRRWKAVVAGVAGTVAGASPWWIWWIANGGDLLALPAGARSPLRHSLELTWNRWVLFQGDKLSPTLFLALAVAGAGLAAAGVWTWLATARRRGVRANFAVLGAVLFLAAFAFAFVFSGFNQANTGRYWVPVWPGMALLGGVACAKTGTGLAATARSIAAWAVVAVLLSVQSALAVFHVRATIARAPRELDRIELLRQAVADTGADALMAPRKEYPMNYAWGEFLPVSDGLLRFYPPIREAAELAEHPAYFTDWMGVATFFDRFGAECRVSGRGRILSDVRPPVPRTAVAWRLGAVAAPEAELCWEGPRGLSSVGFWFHDIPGLRRVRVDIAVRENGEWRTVLGDAGLPTVSWSGTRAYLDGGAYQEFAVESAVADGVRVAFRGLDEGAVQVVDLVAHGLETAGPAVPGEADVPLDAIASMAGDDAAVFSPRWLANRLYRDGRIPGERIRGLSPLVFEKGLPGDVRDVCPADRPVVVVVERRHAPLAEGCGLGEASARFDGSPSWLCLRFEANPGRPPLRWTGRWFSPVLPATEAP